MSEIKFTQSLLEKVKDDLNEKIINNHISHISVINSTDVLMNFSFYSKEKLFISLNHHSPFLSLISKDYAIGATLNGFNENLRRLIKGAYIVEIKILNDDRVLQFTLFKTNDFYEKETMYLILELIPTKSNLIILDENRKILYAFHYYDISTYRPILRGLEYQKITKKAEYKRIDSNYEDFKKEVTSYLLKAERKKKIEQQKPLYDHLVNKKKSLIRKIDILNKEKEKATKGLVYKEYGDTIYAYLYDKESLDNYVRDNLQGIYDDTLSPTDNANKMFKIYKKNKRTIEYDEIEIEKAKQEIAEIERILAIFDYLDDDEINELYNKYMCHGGKPKKSKVDARLPFYIKVNNTTIGFGKNSSQNNYLTFKKANKTDTYLHAKDYHGAHVIIFNNNPSNEELLVASEICLILSNLTTGDILYAKVSELKKGSELGMAYMNNYKIITLREIREETYQLLTTQKRFQN